MEKIEEFVTIIRDKTDNFDYWMNLAITKLQSELDDYHSRKDVEKIKTKLVKEFPEYNGLISTIYNVVDESTQTDDYIIENYEVYAKLGKTGIRFCKSYAGTTQHADWCMDVSVYIGDEKITIREEGLLSDDIGDDEEEIQKLSLRLGVPKKDLFKFIFAITRLKIMEYSALRVRHMNNLPNP